MGRIRIGPIRTGTATRSSLASATAENAAKGLSGPASGGVDLTRGVSFRCEGIRMGCCSNMRREALSRIANSGPVRNIASLAKPLK